MSKAHRGWKKINTEKVRDADNATVTIDTRMKMGRYSGTMFRVCCDDHEISVENENVDVAKKQALALVHNAKKFDWTLWIKYEVEFKRDKAYYEEGTDFEFKWSVIERCNIGDADKERWRRGEITNGVFVPEEHGRVHRELLDESLGRENAQYAERDDEDHDGLVGVIPYDESVIRGLRLIAASIEDASEKLKTLLARPQLKKVLQDMTAANAGRLLAGNKT